MSTEKTHTFLGAALSRAEQAEWDHASLVERLPAITYTEAFNTGRVTSVSPEVDAILGYTQEEWMGDADLWIDRLHSSDRERVVQACVVANQSMEPFREEYRMIARDGAIVWIRDEAVVVRGSRDQPLCWQGVMFDITRERRRDRP
jgi:two-component system sensor histidine kinase UhpB